MDLYLYCSVFLILAYAGLMLLYTYGFFKAKNKFPIKKEQTQPYISIIIPARNEAQNIANCLHSILQNNYPKDKFEIILIDDFSTDKTVQIAQQILRLQQDQLLQLKDFITQEERLNSFKKKALTIGVEHAKGQYIITTDADCITPKLWLQSLANKISTNKNLRCIGAPVNFIPVDNKKNWLYYFQSIDFMTMQGITAASNHLGLGNMSNGANFMFSKATFDAVDGYTGIDQKASGDDMMLMQKINNTFPGSIDYLLETNAIVNTPVQDSWRSFLNQRIRWASKSDSYPQLKMTMILLLVYLTNLNFLILLVVSFFQTNYLKFLIFALISKTLCELIFLFPVSFFFKKSKELIFFLFLQPIHIAYIIVAGFLGKFGTYTWKGRTVK
ncbi:MAG TPA: glycosyltransferase [Edaphocola sp.]|nr:glycosyltransferase [Edaphocola sp.]